MDKFCASINKLSYNSNERIIFYINKPISNNYEKRKKISDTISKSNINYLKDYSKNQNTIIKKKIKENIILSTNQMTSTPGIKFRNIKCNYFTLEIEYNTESSLSFYFRGKNFIRWRKDYLEKGKDKKFKKTFTFDKNENDIQFYLLFARSIQEKNKIITIKSIKVYENPMEIEPALLLNNDINKLFFSISNFTSCTYINNFDNHISTENKIFIICEIDDKSINFINKCWANGIAVIANYKLPNCIPFYINADKFSIIYLKDIIKNYQKNYNKNTTKNKIKSSYLLQKKVKNKKPLVYIPVYGRHEIIKVNINLLKLQTTECDIVLAISNCEDEQIAKELNVDYVYCLNKPLGMKFEILLTYCKIYNSQYLIILGSDDFLYKNYIENMLKYMHRYDFIGLNSWHFLSNNNYYFCNYIDKNKMLGSGRIINSDILDKINWLYYNINLNNSIDHNSFEKIKNLVKYKSIYDENIYIISKKHDDELISSVDVILESKNINIKKCNNILLLSFVKTPLKNFVNKIENNKKNLLYITDLRKSNFNENLVCRLQKDISLLLSNYFDIIDLRELKSLKIKYDKYLIDGTCLNPNTVKLKVSEIYSYLDTIKTFNNSLIVHDIHDWSFGLRNEPITKDEKLIPNLNETEAKKKFKEFIKNYNIKKVISITDGPEFRYYKNYLKDCTRVYLLYHFINSNHFNTFQFNNQLVKENEILFYGWQSKRVYPFRCRLLEICKKHFNVKQIKRKMNFDSKTCENGLAKIISSSWLSIVCTSNYDYYIRKYSEISESGSVVCGNINDQINAINGGNMIILNDKMTDNEILNRIKYYLNNKKILIYLNLKAVRYFEKFNDINYINDLSNIVLDDSNDNNYNIDKYYNIINYNKHVANNININNYMPSQKVDIKLNNNVINIILKQNNSTPGLNINVNLEKGEYLLTYISSIGYENIIFHILDYNYFRSIIVNNICYVYFDIKKKINNFFILHNNPSINLKYNISNLELFQIKNY
jgi:hypothetical protein